MSTPALSPRIREASYASHPRSSRPTPISRPSTSLSSPMGTVAPLAPRRMNDFKTPNHVAHDAKTPSPNYFGLTRDATADVFSSSAAQHMRGNWSPPSSNVRSTAAASPRIIPVDQNPEYEQFRRQSENNRGFALGTFGVAQSSSSAPKESFFPPMKTPLSPKASKTPPPASHDNNNDTKEDDATAKPRSPKRLLSTESPLFPERPRRNSPASFTDTENFGRTEELARFADVRVTRPSLPSRKSNTLTMAGHRAETLPADIVANSKTDGPTLATPQHVVNILESSVEEVLLLDLRVSTQYAKGRITGALSLCIPTTLLKRPSFNVQKLAENFKVDEEREKFERWRSSKCIIVYDANSSQLKDATTCINTLKKFIGEGWTGGSYIIRGGYQEFANKFPSWTANNPVGSVASSAPMLSLGSDRPSVAPVIGGCPMPTTQNAANPFFGNIRQNMDLIGGVGQLSIKHPSTMTEQMEDDLPVWLGRAAKQKDQGKLVADKFLQIEKREQKRMQEALSGNVVYGTPGGSSPSRTNFQIAGVEKGSKNRYNNIWPYEHSRVKLQGVPDGGCDYVNANHAKAAWSNKRYITTQAPLPTTFNDFWDVIWQEDARVIVMLTAESEGGQTKAHNYWAGGQYGHLHLSPLGERRASLEPSRIHNRQRDRPPIGQRRSTNPPKSNLAAKELSAQSPSSEQPYVIVRKFTLANSNEPFERLREITQLQYSSWPDFGAPAHPAHLLGLIEQCDSVVRQVNGTSAASRPDPPNGRPVVVHCSAGCGRTGTFCTVDSVIDMLKRQRQAQNQRQGTPMEVDRSTPSPIGKGKDLRTEGPDGSWALHDECDLIETTVEDFRHQRLSMVQSLRQFVLCYESILEWLVEQQPKSA